MEGGTTNERNSTVVLYKKRRVIEDPAQCQDLLIEILCRLTTAKSVFRLKCVSKRWYSLISSPSFKRLYLNHQVHRKNDNDGTKSFIVEYESCFEYYRLVVSDNHMPCFQRFGLEKHIPVAKRLRIRASCNDLLLCSGLNVADSHLQFFVLNAFTGEYATIPAPTGKDRAPNSVGFVCEPYCYRNNEGDCIINASYRYRVLFFFRMTDGQDFIETYCSETKARCELGLYDERFDRCGNIVAYNEKLYWFNGKDIVICDPFSSDTGLPFLTFLDGTNFGLRGKVCLEVRSDSLRMMKVCGHGRSRVIGLIISSLKGFEAGARGWNFRGYYFSEHETNTLPWFLISKIHSTDVRILGLHPDNDHIAYLDFGNKVILCNWMTRELKEVEVFRQTGHGRQAHFRPCGEFFPISLPLWPTPTH